MTSFTTPSVLAVFNKPGAKWSSDRVQIPNDKYSQGKEASGLPLEGFPELVPMAMACMIDYAMTGYTFTNYKSGDSRGLSGPGLIQGKDGLCISWGKVQQSLKALKNHEINLMVEGSKVTLEVFCKKTEVAVWFPVYIDKEKFPKENAQAVLTAAYRKGTLGEMMASRFERLTNLTQGDYQVIGNSTVKDQFGKYALTILVDGNPVKVNTNGKLKYTLENLMSAYPGTLFSSENPGVLTIGESRPLDNGHKQVDTELQCPRTNETPDFAL